MTRNPTRVPRSPTLRPESLVGRPKESVRSVLEHREVDRTLRYGYGKGALRDALAMLSPATGANVLLPSYVPDGVVEPVCELGLEPRFYAVERDLGPALHDVTARLDGRTAAVLGVHYFGVPGRRFEELRDLLLSRDIPLVDDNAHGALSVSDGRPLGTGGTVGFTSLHKHLPVPNGAVLFVPDVDRVDLRAASLSGVADGFTGGDCRFAAASLLRWAKQDYRAVSGTIDAVRFARAVGRSGPEDAAGGTGASERDPEAIYRRAKVPMSRLTEYLAGRLSADSIVARRRRAYEAWADALAHVDGVDPVFESLPEGTSPQVYPVVVDDPDSFRQRLADRGVRGAYTWPPLPTAVERSDEFAVATHLAEHLVTLPCHQDVRSDAVHEVCEGI